MSKTSSLALHGIRGRDILKSLGGIELQMAIVADLYTDEECPAPVLSQRRIILRQLMDKHGNGGISGRDWFAGGSEHRSFRLLAWDAARNLLREERDEYCPRWARIMDEALGALPPESMSIG